MQVNISEKQLKKAVKESIREMLSEHDSMLRDVLKEAIEDIAIGYAIEQGDKGKFVDEKEIMELLR